MNKGFRWMSVLLLLPALLLWSGCAREKRERNVRRGTAVVQKGTDKAGAGAEKVGDKILGGMEKAGTKLSLVGEKIDQGAKKVGEKLEK